MKPVGYFASFAAIAAATVVSIAGCATKPSAAPAAQAAAPKPASQPAAAPAAANTMSGKIVWVDLKNSALLVECVDNDGCKSVQGKKGETYTLVIPDGMKGTAASWKEGGQVKILFEDRADGGRSLRSVSAP